VKERLTIGQNIRFNRKCVLSATVPKNSKGYTHAVLESSEDDTYVGAGLISEGTEATVIDYVSHGTGTLDYPLVKILGKTAVCHTRLIDGS
jgi:hypothetical protein